MAARRAGDVFANRGRVPRAVRRLAGPPPGWGAGDRFGSGCAAAGRTAVLSFEQEHRRRRTLLARLAAVFYLGSGLLGLVTLPLPAPGLNRVATAAVCAVALAAGVAVWLAPWGAWPRRASLVIVPPALALIALANSFGGSDPHAYSVFFMVAFVWVGLAQPPGTSLVVAPLAAAAYTLPLLWLAGSTGAGLASAATTIPVCVLVGEGIAWGMVRLERIERALHRERSRSEQLRELDQMKDAFLSAASHELRTPITICRGHLEVMDGNAAEREVRAVTKLVVDELDRMGRLVDDLATVTRVDDRVMLSIESLPLDGFLSSVVTTARPILGNRLLVDAEPTGATLRADPQRLAQAVLNLLQNAARHARGDGPVRLRVHAEPSSWRFEVADDGGGLPPVEEQIVFEPFRTGSSPTGQTGLGLSIVRGIARAHGGECGVMNRPGSGATFWIRIPL